MIAFSQSLTLISAMALIAAIAVIWTNYGDKLIAVIGHGA